MHRLRRALRTHLFTAIIALALSTPCAGAELFPLYEVIEPNVAFWVKVYAEYTTSQAIIHDSHNLNVVYDVISVMPYDAPGARKINRDRMKRAKAKYKKILQRLAADPGIDDKDCQRVAGLFEPGTDAATFRRASQQVRSQLGQKDRFQAGVIRSGAFVDEIRAIMKSYGVPEDLAYLPHVESSFNPGAYSKFGAAGIWQFTRSTGRRFMSVDYVLDERRDPIRATHAAAQLLKENYDKLGSWPLAITAYNHGAAGMERARKKHGGYPAVFQSYRSRTFKFASRNFYSEFLAARQVASDHADYFGPLALDEPKPYHSVTLEGYARFEDLCGHYDVETDILRDMNPALRPPVFNDQKYVPKGYRLRLPFSIAENTSDLAAIPPSLLKSKQRPSRFYTVQRGDTAGRIARHHGVRLSDLILANNLNARATIYPRQTLRIPLPGEKVTPAEPETPVVVTSEAPVLVAALDKGTGQTTAGSAESSTSPAAPQLAATAAESEKPTSPSSQESSGDAQEPQVKTSPGREAAPEVQVETATAPENSEETVEREIPETEEPLTTPATPARAPAQAAEQPREPTSAPGEIAEPAVASTAPSEEMPPPESATPPPSEMTPPTPVAEAPPPILAETPLPIPTTTVMPNTEIVAIDVRFTRMTELNKQPVGILQVEVEETLGHYAEWAGVRTQQIRRLNGLRYGRTLRLGQKVKIPLDAIDAAAFEEQRYEYHKRLQEDFFAAYRVAELEPYRVQQGDNIWTLCRDKFGVPMWLLKHYNMDTDLAALHIHQKLMIPIIPETTAGDPGAVTNDTAHEEEIAEPTADAPSSVPPQENQEH